MADLLTFSFARETSKQIITLATCSSRCSSAWVRSWALTGHLGQGTEPKANAIYSENVQFAASLQVASFLGAVGFTIAFGISAA